MSRRPSRISWTSCLVIKNSADNLFVDFSPTPAHSPDAHQGNFFGWILPTLRTSEFTILQTVGLDAAVLLNFYRMAFFLFTLLAILAGVVLMPLNLFRHGSTDSEYDPIRNDTDTNGTIALGTYYLSSVVALDNNGTLIVPPGNHTQPRTSPSTYDYLLDPQLSNTINLLFTYLFTGLTLIFLHRNFHRFVQSRQSFALHLIHSISARTVLVTNVPQYLRGDRALSEYFEGCGWMIESVNVCREVEPLRRILEKRTNALLKLEQAWVEWVGNPANVRGHDPNVYGDVGKGKKKSAPITESPEPEPTKSNAAAEGTLIPDLDNGNVHEEGQNLLNVQPGGMNDAAVVTSPHSASTEHIHALNGESMDTEGGEPHIHVHTTRSRPMYRPRAFGNAVDAIGYWEKKFRAADEKVREMRQKGSFGATHVAFVTFENVQDAVRRLPRLVMLLCTFIRCVASSADVDPITANRMSGGALSTTL